MKKLLLHFSLFLISFNLVAQAPEIQGDVLLCPWTEGTASVITDQEYDSYQWYYKYWFLPEDYVAIEGANAATFTYDWYTYDQALLKVVVTLNGETFESNVIQIDSWAWTGLILFNEVNENVSFDPDTESFLLCQGATFELSINNPPYDTNIRWYRNDEPIAGANSSVYVVSEPGLYYVEAAPSFCPDNSNNSLPINVLWDPDCNLSIEDPIAQTPVKIYPNPVKNQLTVNTFATVAESYKIVDLTGKTVSSGSISESESQIDMTALSNGIYILHLQGNQQQSAHKIIKE